MTMMPFPSKMPIVWATATLLVLVGVTPAWTQAVYTDGPSPEAETAFEQGKTALEQEQYDDAVGLLSKAIRIAEDEYAEAFLLRGQAFMKLKDHQQAAASFQKAVAQIDSLEDDTLKAQAYNGLGEAYLDFGAEGVGAALPNFVDATQIDYKNADYLLNLGTTLVKLRSPDRAITTLDKVIEMNTESAEAYDARAQAHGMLAPDKPEELDLAMADFDKAIALDPNDKTFYYNMGLVLLQNDRLEAAIGALTQAIATDQAQAAKKAAASAPQGPPPAATPGGAPDQNDAVPSAAPPDPIAPTADVPQPGAETFPGPAYDGEEATAAAEDEDEDEGPYIQPYLARAIALTELGKTNVGELQAKAYQLAVMDVDQALALVPKMPDALLIRGVALRLLGDYDGAVASLTEALKMNPQFGEALYRRGIIWFYLGEHDLALADLKQASQINPQDARTRVWEGYAHAGKGDYYEAVNAYSRALEQNDRFEPAHNNRGLAYLRLGQYDKAISDFNEVIRLAPSDSNAYFKRGLALEMMDHIEHAIASYQVAVQTDQNNVAAYRRLAELYRRRGHDELAQRARQDADEAARRVEQAKLAPPPTGALPEPPPGGGLPLDTELLPTPTSGLFSDPGLGLDAAGSELSLPAADAALPDAGELAPDAPLAEPQLAPPTDLLSVPPTTSGDATEPIEFDLFN